MTQVKAAGLWVESLWDYANRVYAHKEVESLVLDMQDEYYANVDIILWCCWLDSEGIPLSCEVLDDILISVDTVSQSTLLKIRDVRRYLKNTASFTPTQSKVITKQLLNAELVIEKVLLFRMQDLTRRFAILMRDERAPLSLRYYLEFLGIPDAPQLARMVQTACKLRSSYS
ncbi:TIGR02444 family protein [Teredinibacter waterburyi]|uniref:TIGR02444 family protein n=1 Tax=Teredinibacter waterburyi TaxID=1500538 RepID=UPI00165F8593|nr:TIGR02444 family protein [Teredinibacter waterburyi]